MDHPSLFGLNWGQIQSVYQISKPYTFLLSKRFRSLLYLFSGSFWNKFAKLWSDLFVYSWVGGTIEKTWTKGEKFLRIKTFLLVTALLTLIRQDRGLISKDIWRTFLKIDLLIISDCIQLTFASFHNRSRKQMKATLSKRFASINTYRHATLLFTIGNMNETFSETDWSTQMSKNRVNCIESWHARSYFRRLPRKLNFVLYIITLGSQRLEKSDHFSHLLANVLRLCFESRNKKLSSY